MQLIDERRGLRLVRFDCDLFVDYEVLSSGDPSVGASLLFAHHEGELHDYNGEHVSLTDSQQRIVGRWAGQFL